MIMTLTIISLCLIVQRFFEFELRKPQQDWFRGYYYQCEQWFSRYSWWSSYVGVVLLVVIATLSYVLLFSLLGMLLSDGIELFINFIVGSLVLAYYLSATPYNAETSGTISVSKVFAHRYHHIFAILYWFILLGPFAVILYVESRRLSAYLLQESSEKSNLFGQKLLIFCDLMEWLPLRLLGLTYALVGQFNAAFRYWYQSLRNNDSAATLSVAYGMQALNWGDEMQQSSSEAEIKQVETLVTRAVIIWVIMLGLFALGYLMAHS